MKLTLLEYALCGLVVVAVVLTLAAPMLQDLVAVFGQVANSLAH